MSLEDYKKCLAQQASGRLINVRSTLNAKNAAVFKPFFEELLKPDIAAVDVEYSLFKCSSRTVYLKLLDAMRWFIVHDEHETTPALTPERRYEYMKLRAQWKLECSTDKIRIYKTTAHAIKRPDFSIKSYATETAAEQHTAATTWRQELMDYIQNAPEGDQPFKREIAVFGDEDRVYMKNVCLQLDIGWAYEKGWLTVVK